MISQEEKDVAVFDKRKHVRVTTLCNNNCVFCLNADETNRKHKSVAELKRMFIEGVKEGCTRLILSGGEPSTHPDFLKIIRLGKEACYKKIQTITNGRMYCYENFLRNAINAGLDEITFSIHGHTPELHDSLTRSPGSFKQTVQGIKNALKHKVIVSADIVLNKQNYKYFPAIIDFLTNLGVMEFDILYPVPFGNAWRNKDLIYFDVKKALPYIHKGFNLAKERDAVLWTNRFPAKYLAGYEELIQDSHKLLDEMEGRKDMFESCLEKNKEFRCRGERCKLCNMEPVCNRLLEVNKKVRGKGKLNREVDNKKTAKIVISKSNYKELSNIAKSMKNFNLYVFELAEPSEKLSDYKAKATKISEILPYLKKAAAILGDKIRVRNIPPCFIDKRYVDNSKEDFKCSYLKPNGQIDVIKFTEDFAKSLKIKGLQCDKCKYNSHCGGIFQKYIKIFGFKELKPTKIFISFRELNQVYKEKFGPLSDFLPELLGVKHKLKSLAIITLKNKELDGLALSSLKEHCKANNLFAISRCGQKRNEYYFCLSSSKDALKSLSHLSNHETKEIGQLLSYPNCCVNKFLNKNTASYYFINNVEERIRNSGEGFSWYLNKFFLSTPLYLISHLPCSYNCKRSINYAKKMLNLIKKERPSLYRDIKHYLKLPLFFTDFGGSALAFEGILTKKTSRKQIVYSSFYGSSLEHIKEMLSKSVKKPNIEIYRKIIKGLVKGNKVSLNGGSINIFRNNRKVAKIKKPAGLNWYFIGFKK